MTTALHAMALRIELVKAWHELESTVVQAVQVRPVRDGKGLWWAQPIPTARGIERHLGKCASSAVRIAMGVGAQDPVQRRDAQPRDIREAQRLIINTLDGYRQESFGWMS